MGNIKIIYYSLCALVVAAFFVGYLMGKDAKGMVDIDEYIELCETVAEKSEESLNDCDMTDEIEAKIATTCARCAEEHRQLSAWLQELKLYRAAWEGLQQDMGKIDNRGSVWFDYLVKCINDRFSFLK